MNTRLALGFAAGLLAVALVVSLGGAQEGQKGKGRRGGGFGMFGGGGMGLVALAGNEAVQKDLGVDEATASKLRTISDDFRTAMRDEMSSAGVDFQNFANLSEDERQKMREKMTAANKKVNDSFEPKLKEALTADQLKRLKEISIQAAGVNALSDPAVVKELGLSDEQTKKIAAIREDYAAKQRELFSGGGGPEAFTKMRELREEETKKATEVLTGEQQSKLTAMKGKTFDVAQLRGGFGPGGGKGGKGRRPKEE